MKQLIIIFLICWIPVQLFSQSGSIKGVVVNQINREPVSFAGIGLQNTELRATAADDGSFEIKNIPPGIYNLTVRAVGFRPLTLFELEITGTAPLILTIELEEEVSELEDVVITARPFSKTEESPLSLHTLGSSEIKRNPGGNRDISKVLQSLPGVASSPSFRNDIFIRGGAPNENRFYLDGVEVPNINHFATQGSSGGPVGMINVDLIREVDLFTGAFPASRGNALSSVMEFKMRDGNSEKHVFSGTIGASDLGVTAEGPVSSKASYLFSARRSYLQFLFSALGLPFLPTYNDAQFKVKYRPTDKDEIVLLGLGAIDDFTLNLDANETEAQQYFLNNIPVNTQWNYTGGASWKHFREKSYWTLVLSRNQLSNRAYKYAGNDESDPANRILDYRSTEAENKLRVENTWRDKGWKLNYGILFERAEYTNSTFSKRVLPFGVLTIDYNSGLSFNKYGAFFQAGKTFVKDRLTLSAGLRSDASDYSSSMSDPLDQLSPRLSASFKVTSKISFNANTGIYYQLPAYTVLGYRDSMDRLVNKENSVRYIQVSHYVAGWEWLLSDNVKVTLEGFLKPYRYYPFLVEDSIALANLGSDFGVIGNAPVVSSSKGEARGLELMIQRKMLKDVYGILSYTFVYSRFTDKNDELIASSWDNRHILNLVAGKKFKRNWEAGIKWRFLGGAPYSPFDLQLSSQQAVWDVTGAGIPDYDKLNSERLPSVHQLDIRIDKKWYFKKWMMDLYLVIQNLYNFKTDFPPYLTLERDASGQPIPDPQNPGSYKMKYLENESGTLLPTVGCIIEF